MKVMVSGNKLDLVNNSTFLHSEKIIKKKREVYSNSIFEKINFVILVYRSFLSKFVKLKIVTNYYVVRIS